MREWIRSLSLRAEFVIVMLVAFGYFILVSVWSVLIYTAPESTDTSGISESALTGLVVHEIIVFALVWWFLHVRGWRFRMVGLIPSRRDTMIGVGIVLLMYVIYTLLWILFGHLLIDHHVSEASGAVSKLSLFSIAAVSVINPVFEEVFVCGYLITALSKTRSMSYAINVSVAIRLAYHLYQGAAGVFNIIPLGILFAYWYARTGRLWPLVIAHGIFDFVGLVIFLKH